MTSSNLVARIMAVIYVSSGIAIILNQINFKKMTDDFNKSTALTYIGGALGIVIGMLLATYHNIWIRNWTVLITIIGWAFLIGGIITIVFPKSLSYFAKFYKQSRLWGVFMICFGLMFGYFGFIR